MAFAASIDLSALDGTTGFRISGGGGSWHAGLSVASAGDVNGDGVDDLIIGASGFTSGDMFGAPAYVVFGRDTDAAGAFAADLNLGALDGTDGFRLVATDSYDGAGHSVASAGDINGDGLGDLIVGTYYATSNGEREAGAAFVVFGSATGFAAALNLSTLNGTNGFRINGANAYDRAGTSVASAGDVDGDGIDDLIIGAWCVGPYAQLHGAAYVVFGRDTATEGAFAATLELDGLGANGFGITGAAANNYIGNSVASAGDVNGDGIDDLIIGAMRADGIGQDSGESYVVFGSDSGGFPGHVGALDGTNGFKISAGAATDRMGRSVSAAGDINGDGVGDLIVGAYSADLNTRNSSGASYVVFGKNTAVAGAFAADLNVSTLDGTNGFRISGAVSGDFSGWSVASAGDVNGDGIDDLIIGAWGADPHQSQSGASYVVFGRNTAVAGNFGVELDLGTLNGTNGFRIAGVALGDRSGWSVASAGDVNGDGIDDLIVGATYADPAAQYNAGASYVIYGRLDFTGSAGNETQSGGASNDSLAGLDGNDVLSGLAGDDILDGGALADILHGGAGADDLLGGTGGDILNGDDGNDQLSGDDGADKLTGGAGSDYLFGGSGNDRMGGEADVDTLEGGSGNDYMDGGLGADVMSGGTDNDVYIVDSLGDQTIELAGEGVDIVRTAIDGWVLADNVEALQLQGADDVSGTGNSGANNMQGNSGANTLYGLAGNDTINGNDGDDVIIGGLGGDQLRGGIGLDIFVVGHAFAAGLETDNIHDFSAAEGDILDLTDAFAGTLSIVSAFTDTAGEMTVSFAGGLTTVKLDIDGNGVAEYQLRINGDVTGETGDWLL